jgi:hypothetical protein
MLKALFWLLVALDALGIGLWFLLGLAAAGPSKTHPLSVVFFLLLLPGTVLTGAVLLWMRGPAEWMRVVALVLVGAPLIALALSSLSAGAWLQRNPGGIYGETKLTRALRELDSDPQQMETVRRLLREGADPNEEGDMLPLMQAIYMAGRVGDEPLRLLLDAGADPNRKDQFGSPAWFAATGATVDPAVMTLLIERGADMQATGNRECGGVWGAWNTRNLRVALLLVERGATLGGISPMGLDFVATLEAEARQRGSDAEISELLAAVRRR